MRYCCTKKNDKCWVLFDLGRHSLFIITKNANKEQTFLKLCKYTWWRAIAMDYIHGWFVYIHNLLVTYSTREWCSHGVFHRKRELDKQKLTPIHFYNLWRHCPIETDSFSGFTCITDKNFITDKIVQALKSCPIMANWIQ